MAIFVNRFHLSLWQSEPYDYITINCWSSGVVASWIICSSVVIKGITLVFLLGLTSSGALYLEDGSAHPLPQFNLNCSNNTVEQLKKLSLARGISGAISLLTVSSILFFLVFYKAYGSTLQRLFFHLTIVTCLYDITVVIELEHQFEYDGQKEFLKFVTFMDMWTSYMAYSFIFWINTFLFYTVYRELSGVHRDPSSRISNSKYLRLILEVLLYLQVIFIPFAFLWLPFTTVVNDAEDCKTIPIYIIFMVAILIAFACICQIPFTVGFAVGFCRLARTYQGIKDKHLKNVRDVLLLMCFLLISVVLNIPAIVFVPVMDVTENYACWIFASVGPTFSMMFYSIGFFFYLYSTKKLKWESIKKAADEWKTSCGCKHKQRQVHFRQRPATQYLVTNPSSHPPVLLSLLCHTQENFQTLMWQPGRMSHLYPTLTLAIVSSIVNEQ